jgi:hypothetical protein
MTSGDERKLTGAPAVTAKPVDGTTTHATDGAPLARRHDRQWQSVLARDSAVTR